MWPNLQFPADLVTFTEEILYGKLYFLCSIYYRGVFRTLPNIYSKASLQKLLTTKNCYLQSDLPVAYMLYSGHLKIVDTFSWNQPNHLMLFCGKTKRNCYSIFKCFHLTLSSFTFSELSRISQIANFGIIFVGTSFHKIVQNAKFAKYSSFENYLETSLWLWLYIADTSFRNRRYPLYIGLTVFA